MPKTRLLPADDHPLFLESLAALFAADSEFEVVGSAGDGQRLLPLVGRLQPDLVLLDVQMPGRDGLSCLAAIRERHPQVRVVMVSGEDSPVLVERALAGGAAGYILKTIEPDDLRAALRQIVQGTFFTAMKPVEPASSSGLTGKELTVLRAVADGCSNQEIARSLYVTEATVKFHLTSIYRKLGVANRTEAARVAFRDGLARSPAFDEVA